MPLTGKTILVVDDDAFLREALTFDLSLLGASTLEAGNGEEAFGMLESRHVDAVISDIRMPKVSGLELLEKIRNRHTVTPYVILMTGFADFNQEDMLKKGAVAVFPKPMDRKRMHDFLSQLLN
jgi:CheY-like chemotaxis protein